MSRSKQHYLPEPRILSSQHQVATLLDKPQSWFRKNRHELEKNGFPQFDPLLEGWDMNAINLWIDCRSCIERPGMIAMPGADQAPRKEATVVFDPLKSPKVYSVKTAAARMGFSADTIYSLINREELACIRRPNCAIRIKEEHVRAYEEKFEQQALSPEVRHDRDVSEASAADRAAATATACSIASHIRAKQVPS